jgi:DNA-binding CsgD family transcriptional regulator
LRGDGDIVCLEVHNFPIYDDQGTLIAMEGTVRDVTDRERILGELRASEARQRRVAESLPDLLMRCDATGTFFEQVPTSSKQPGNLFLGKKIEDVAPPQARPTARSAFNKALAGASATFRCQINVWEDERSYEFRLVPTGDGEVLAFLRDVTGEVWAEAEEERRRSRDQFEDTVQRQFGIRNPYQFTFREFTVLHLVARGAADKEIANQLGVALSTVNKHVSNILGKMGAGSRTEAGVRAVQEGLVSGK